MCSPQKADGEGKTALCSKTKNKGKSSTGKAPAVKKSKNLELVNEINDSDGEFEDED